MQNRARQANNPETGKIGTSHTDRQANELTRRYRNKLASKQEAQKQTLS